MSRKTLLLLRWGLLLGWMTLIFALSHQNKRHSSETSQWVLRFFTGLGLSEEIILRWQLSFYVRKLAHFSEYAVLYLLARPLIGSGWRSWLFCLAYAASDELHQAFVPGRGASPWDVLLDSAGALAGALLQRLLPQKAPRAPRNAGIGRKFS
jgi:VanZ family protein